MEQQHLQFRMFLWAKHHELTDNTIENLEKEGLTDYDVIETLTDEEIASITIDTGQGKLLNRAVQLLKNSKVVSVGQSQYVCKHFHELTNTEDQLDVKNYSFLPLKCKVEKTLLKCGSPSIHKRDFVYQKCYADTARVEKTKVEKENHHISEKVILVVGATGSGKTTLINSMVNYIFGVDFFDDCKLKLIVECTGQSQAQSQTSSITSYTIQYQDGMQVPFTLTIIDTPGFGDTSGITRDREITNEILEYFTRKDGLDHLDAVCFVAQSSMARLTASQRYIFDSILSLFGKDIKENICLMLTFADGQKPVILDALQHAGLPTESNKFFKFNNASFADKAKGSLVELFTNNAMKSFHDFFNQLNHLKTKPINLITDVLQERAKLEVHLNRIQSDKELALSKQQVFNKQKEALQMYENEPEQNKDFVYTTEEVSVVPEPVKHLRALNCKLCIKTCHDSCAVIGNGMTWACEVIKNRECKICSHKSSDHTVDKYRYSKSTVETKKANEDVKQKYLKAKEGRDSVAAIMDILEKEIKIIKTGLHVQEKAIRRSLKRLDEIALKPNPLTTTDYIDMLIECEKGEGKDGWKERVASLVMFRKNAEQLQMIKDDKV